MNKIEVPTAGTQISSGTGRTEDLLRNFADAIEKFVGINDETRELVNDMRGTADAIENHPGESQYLEDADVLIFHQAWLLLYEVSPPRCYFGLNEGDSTSYGWWQEDAVELAWDIKSLFHYSGNLDFYRGGTFFDLTTWDVVTLIKIIYQGSSVLIAKVFIEPSEVSHLDYFGAYELSGEDFYPRLHGKTRDARKVEILNHLDKWGASYEIPELSMYKRVIIDPEQFRGEDYVWRPEIETVVAPRHYPDYDTFIMQILIDEFGIFEFSVPKES